MKHKNLELRVKSLEQILITFAIFILLITSALIVVLTSEYRDIRTEMAVYHGPLEEEVCSVGVVNDLVRRCMV